jgi:hypothetical protein
MCPSGFFSRFFGIRLAELQIDPQLESTIRSKARGLHTIWNAILRITLSIWFFVKTSRVLLKTFERSTRGRLRTTREDFKTTQRSAREPSSLGMIQTFLRTFDLWSWGHSRTTRQGRQDYSKTSYSTTKYLRACCMDCRAYTPGTHARKEEDRLLLEFPCNPTRTRSV